MSGWVQEICQGGFRRQRARVGQGCQGGSRLGFRRPVYQGGFRLGFWGAADQGGFRLGVMGPACQGWFRLGFRGRPAGRRGFHIPNLPVVKISLGSYIVAVLSALVCIVACVRNMRSSSSTTIFLLQA